MKTKQPSNEVQWSLSKRPSKLDDVIVGNPDVITLAREHIKSAQAILITGETGTGKTTIAEAMAREINGAAFERCYIYKDASNQGIDSIRALQEQIRYSPQGKRWIVVLDEAHGYSGASQKALLTLLEKKNSKVLFILCTNLAYGIPKEIKDRCRKLNIQKPTYEQAKLGLFRILKAENINLEKVETFKLIKKALQDTDFCLRDTMQVLEDCYNLIQAGKSFKSVMGLEKAVSSDNKVTNVEMIAGSLLIAVTQAGDDLNKSLKYIMTVFAEQDPVNILTRMQGILYYGFAMKNGGKFNWQAKSYDQIFAKQKLASDAVAIITFELSKLIDQVKLCTGDKAILAASGLSMVAMRQAK